MLVGRDGCRSRRAHPRRIRGDGSAAASPQEGAEPADSASDVKAALGLIKTLRPHQWVKNVFVAAPLVFAQHLTEVPYLWRTGAAILVFCLLSGAVYAFNDVRDVESDRAHPKKKHRPIASGQL